MSVSEYPYAKFIGHDHESIPHGTLVAVVGVEAENKSIVSTAMGETFTVDTEELDTTEFE